MPEADQLRRIGKFLSRSALGGLVLWLWLTLGAFALGFFNFFFVYRDFMRAGDTPAWVGYAELVLLLLVWPIILIEVTARWRTLRTSILIWLAVVGAVSLVTSGWYLAGHSFVLPLDRLLSGGLLFASALAGAWLTRHASGNPPRP
jgi:hypothetical protein